MKSNYSVKYYSFNFYFKSMNYKIYKAGLIPGYHMKWNYPAHLCAAGGIPIIADMAEMGFFFVIRSGNKKT